MKKALFALMLTVAFENINAGVNDLTGKGFGSDAPGWGMQPQTPAQGLDAIKKQARDKGYADINRLLNDASIVYDESEECVIIPQATLLRFSSSASKDLVFARGGDVNPNWQALGFKFKWMDNKHDLHICQFSPAQGVVAL